LENKVLKLREIVETVKGTVLTKQGDLDLEISYCGASDLLSDVLSDMKPGSLLLTGMVSLQSVRTAEMVDLAAIVFVCAKIPRPESIELANELGIPLIASPYSMYEICGRLYQAGLRPPKK
jgi:predicted transcriptional regulator